MQKRFWFIKMENRHFTTLGSVRTVSSNSFCLYWFTSVLQPLDGSGWAHLHCYSAIFIFSGSTLFHLELPVGKLSPQKVYAELNRLSHSTAMLRKNKNKPEAMFRFPECVCVCVCTRARACAMREASLVDVVPQEKCPGVAFSLSTILSVKLLVTSICIE